MATNLKLEDGLLEEAFALSGLKTKRDAVTVALKEFIMRRRQLKALELEGQIDFDPEWDYKAQRNRK